MTSVAFAATLIHGPAVMGPDMKTAFYKVQLPTATTSGGDTMDVSADFDFVYAGSCNVSGVVTDNAYKYSIVGGTYDSTDGGYPAATIKLVAHQSKGSNAAMDEADSVDLSAVNDLIVQIWGK